MWDKKGLIGIFRLSLVLISLFILGFLTYSSLISAESVSQIWTTDADGNPKIDFAPYTTVYIHGSNFLERSNVNVFVTRPDDVIDEEHIFSDIYGSFICEYGLDEGINGFYSVLATDGTNTAETTFNDSVKVNLDQWANKDNEWQNGNLNPSNSEYREGDAVPFRLIIKGLPGGSHTIHLNYDYCGQEYTETVQDAECSCDYTNWQDDECVSDGYMRQTRTETSGHDYCDESLTREIQNEICDCSPPETTIDISDPNYEFEFEYNETSFTGYFVTSSTKFTLNAVDTISGVNVTYYIICAGETEEETEECMMNESNWKVYEEPFTIPGDDGMYIIMYGSGDNAGNWESSEDNWLLIILDNTLPEIIKDVTEPYVGDCPPVEGDKCYIQEGITKIIVSTDDGEGVNEVECEWRYKLDGEWQNDWTPYVEPIIFYEDSTHELHIICWDALGNEAEDIEVFLVDSTPPVTWKFYGEPYYTEAIEGYENPEEYQECLQEWKAFCKEECKGNIDCLLECVYLDAYEECGYYLEWITSSTPITLEAEDGGEICAIGVDEIYYRNILLPDEFCYGKCYPIGLECDLMCKEECNGDEECYEKCYGDCASDICNYYCDEDPNLEECFAGCYGVFTQEWVLYEGPFNKEEESCHLIEYYAIDYLGNEEIWEWQCVFVENTPPVITKEVGDPKVEGEGFYYITNETPIYLYCEDSEPHPSGVKEIWYRWYLYEEEPGEWEEYPIDTIYITEESYHVLEYYCVDNLGHKSELHEQYYDVEDQTCLCQYTCWEDDECVLDGFMRQVRYETTSFEYCEDEQYQEIPNEICDCESEETGRECVDDGFAEVTYGWNYDYCGQEYTDTVQDAECSCQYTCWEDAECVSDGYMRQIRTETTGYPYCEEPLEQEVPNELCNCEAEESGSECVSDGFAEVTYSWNYDYCGDGFTDTVEDQNCLCQYTCWEDDECVSDGFMRQIRYETTEFDYCEDEQYQEIEDAVCNCDYSEWQDDECIEDGIMRQLRTETSGHDYCDADLIREIEDTTCDCISTEISRECVANVTALINYSWNYPYCEPDSEYVYDESCLICIPSWICTKYSDCTSENYQYCTQVQDTHSCGECYTGDYSEFIKECSYCSIHGPKITTADEISVYEGDLITLNIEMTDPDEDPLTYSISAPVGNDKEWQTQEGDKGEYNVLITVSDGICTTEKTINIIVKEESQQSLIIKRTNYNEFIKPSEIQELYITLENTGNENIEDLKITAFIDSLGIWKTTRKFDLKKGDETTKLIEFSIPYYAPKGGHYIRIVVSNDKIRRVIYRDFDVI